MVDELDEVIISNAINNKQDMGDIADAKNILSKPENFESYKKAIKKAYIDAYKKGDKYKLKNIDQILSRLDKKTLSQFKSELSQIENVERGNRYSIVDKSTPNSIGSAKNTIENFSLKNEENTLKVSDGQKNNKITGQTAAAGKGQKPENTEAILNPEKNNKKTFNISGLKDSLKNISSKLKASLIKTSSRLKQKLTPAKSNVKIIPTTRVRVFNTYLL